MIDNTHVSKSEYGVISVIVNTIDKWVNYDVSQEEDCIVFDWLTKKHSTVDLIEYLTKEEEFRYIMLHEQCKDQIIVYLIPLRLVKGDAFINHMKSAMLKNKL